MSMREHDPLSIHLTCRDMKTSVAFYRDTLGFELEKCWPDEKNPLWANMMLGTQSVMLGQALPPDEAAGWCKDDPEGARRARAQAQEFQEHKSGVGVTTYVRVPDIDGYRAALTRKGLKDLAQPKTQFYGIRELPVQDPDGYLHIFYSPVQMSSCQSCGMPLEDAKPGEMFCRYCTDEKGVLKPYEQVLEGTTVGYFMGMQKMARPEAEKAARSHLAKMPAWAGRQ